MNISHRQLRMFVVLAKHLNFTHAAKALYVTQPAISMQIKQLEQEMGLALFEFMGKKMYLTEAGKQTLIYAENVLRELSALDDSINDIKGIKRGHLRIATANSLSPFTAKLIAKYIATYPEINVTMEVGNRQQQLDALSQNQIDLAIMGHEPDSINVQSHCIKKTEIIAVAAPSNPLTKALKVTLAQLANQRFLYGEPGSGTRVAMDHSFTENHLDQSHIEVSNNEMVKHCIQQGIGIGLLPKISIETELKHGLLKVLNVENFPIAYEVNLVHHQQKKLSLVAREFIKQVIN